MSKDLKERSRKFAHGAVNLALALPNNVLGYHVQKQLMRAATSVAANYRATSLAQTKRAFISKLSVVIEESDECIFWIEFLRTENLLKEEVSTALLREAKELTAIFVASRKTAEKSLERTGPEERKN